MNREKLELLRNLIEVEIDAMGAAYDKTRAEQRDGYVAALESLNRVGNKLAALLAEDAPVSAAETDKSLPLMAVPQIHNEHEDCNCEAVGYAEGWNAAIRALGGEVG